MLNKLLKTSFILVLAISLTACTGSKKKTPGDSNSGDGSDGGNKETLKTLCEKYPESDLCKLIDSAVEMNPEDAKVSASIQTNGGNGEKINISYQDMATWNSTLDIPLTNINFSGDVVLRMVYSGNSDLLGIRFTSRIYAVDTGKNVGPTSNNTGSFLKEGVTTNSAVMFMNYPEARTGKNILVITFEKDGKKYFINFPNFTLSSPATN